LVQNNPVHPYRKAGGISHPRNGLETEVNIANSRHLRFPPMGQILFKRYSFTRESLKKVGGLRKLPGFLPQPVVKSQLEFQVKLLKTLYRNNRGQLIGGRLNT
jgi:hypothetical protein